jgi:TonB-linked SusC/RagA family outer membrane protein
MYPKLKFGKFFLLCSLLLLAGATVFGQKREVTGVVKDTDNTPLIGANVVVMGTQNTPNVIGTATNVDGEFSLQVPQGRDSLVVSYTGYKPGYVSIRNKSRVEVVLQSAASELKEVVVTAMGIKREEKALGYSVQSVQGEDMENTDKMSPLEGLSGEVAGLNITSTGSGPGGSVNILIRGLNSITGSNEPLIVIDGVPIDNSGGASGTAFGGFDYGNAANNINPENIENISVLKGGAASALYGYRGSNGVIMITTKQGESSQGLGVSFNSSVSFSEPVVRPNFQSRYSQGSAGSFEPNSFRSWGTKMTGQNVTNFLEQEQTLNPRGTHPYETFYRTGISYDNSVSINKRGEQNGIYFSANWTKTQGIQPNNVLDKKNLTLRYDSKLSEFLTFDAKANYINQQVDNRPNLSGSPDNPVYMMTHLPPSVRLSQLKPYQTIDGYPVVWTSEYTKNQEGSVQWRNGPPAFATSPLLQNPYWAVNLNNNQDKRHRLIGFTELNLDMKEWFALPFNLNVKGKVGLDYYNDTRKRLTAHNTYYKADGTATLNESKSEVMEMNYDLQITARDRFGSFSTEASVGAHLRHSQSRGIYTSSESGLINEDGPYVIQNFNNPITNDGISEREVQSVYGLFNIGYNEAFYLDFTLRNDWSSNLSPENWSYLYPSVSGSWLVHETFSLPEVVDFLKVRGSWAEVGSSGDLSSFRYFQYSTNPSQYRGLPYGGLPGNRPNRSIHAEYTVSKELGLKAILLGNRLDVDATFYQTGTRDQILNSPLPPSSGFNQGYINAGYINNSGVELSASYDVLKDQKFNLTVGGNFTRQWSEVEELAEGQDIQVIGEAADVVTAARMNQPVGMIMGTAFARNDEGKKIIDDDNLPRIATTEEGALDYEQVIGNSFPKILWGGNIRMSYDQLYFSLSVDSKMGHDIFSLTNQRGAEYGTLGYTTEGRDAWEKAKEISDVTGVPPQDGYMVHGVKNGQEGDYPVDPQKYWDRVARIHEAFVYDASYIRLKQANLTYRFDFSDNQQMPFRNLSVSVYGNNLFYIMRNTKNISPRSSFGSNRTGIEMYAQPELRNYGMKVQFTF